MPPIRNPLVGADWPATKLRAVTPDDDNDLAGGACRALYIGTAGDITLIASEDEDEVTLPDCPAGILPVATLRVLATGTDADGIVALY